MPKFEITLVVEAPNLSTAVSKLLWDEEGEPNRDLIAIQFAEEKGD